MREQERRRRALEVKSGLDAQVTQRYRNKGVASSLSETELKFNNSIIKMTENPEIKRRLVEQLLPHPSPTNSTGFKFA